MLESLTHIEALSELSHRGAPFVAVTLVEVQGSTPQNAGAKMLVDASGRVHGTVGGGKLELRAIEFAAAMLHDSDRQREIVEWNLQRDIGMTCGGLVKLFFEVYERNQWNVFVFGAGHVAQALIQVLLTLNCRVTCLDTRPEWLAKLPDHHRLKIVCSENLAAETSRIKPDSFVVCMTMGHATDRPILASLFRSGIRPAFLGVIGSKSKRAVLLRELKSEGILAEVAESFLCPVGLPIGSNQPAEIAISITAQMLEFRDHV